MDLFQAKTEIMRNALAARVIQPGGAFFAVRGSGEKPLIFSAGSNNRLYTIRQDPGSEENGEIDLSKAFKLPDGHSIHTAAVTQDNSSMINLAFAAGSPGGPSSVYLVKPFTSDQVMLWDSNSDLTSLLIPGHNKNKEIHILKLHLGASVPSKSASRKSAYPPLFVGYEDLSTKRVDLCSIIVESTGEEWSFSNELQLPVTAECILDFRATRIERDAGVFVLTRETENSNPELRLLSLFKSDNEYTLKGTEQRCPSGASRISTVTNDDGNDDLVIAGSGLHYLKGTDCEKGKQGPELKVLSTDSMYQSPKQLEIAQEGDNITVWFTDANSDLHYQEYKRQANLTWENPRPIIPFLFEEKVGGEFAPVRLVGGGQQLFVNGMKNGQPVLTAISQNVHSRLWQTSPVSIPALEEMVQFVSYTTRIEVTDAKGLPLKGAHLSISTSIPTEIIINGTRMSFDKSSQLITTDDYGTLTIIIPGTENALPADCPVMTLAPVKDSTNTYSGSDFIINPGNKMSEVTKTLASVEELKKLKEKGLIGPEVGNEQLEKAADVFSGLKAAASSLNEQGEVSVDKEGDFPTKYTYGFEEASLQSAAAQSFADFWTLIKKGFKEMLNWGVQKLGEGWAFVIELSGRVHYLIVKTISHIAQAAVKVFEYVKMGIEKIIEYVGFLFRWDDIIKTKNVFVNLMTQSMIWGSDNLAALQQGSDKFFKDLESMAQDLKHKELPAALSNSKVGGETAKKESEKYGKATHQEDVKSPGSSWGQYHLQHGDKAIASLLPSSDQRSSSITDELAKIWEEVKTLVGNLASNIKKLLESTDKPIGELLKDTGIDLLTDIVKVTAQFVSSIIGLIKTLMHLLAAGMTTEIKIPVLSPLYESISGGAKLTSMDAICLVIAIPATVSYKLFTGQSPKEIPGIEYLTKPNIYLEELLKKLKFGDAQDDRITFEKQNFSQDKVDFQPDSRPAVAAYSHSDFGAKHSEKSSTDNGPPSDMSFIWDSQYYKDTALVETLLHFSIPWASSVLFNGRTVPSWYMPDTGPPKNGLAMYSAAFIWTAQMTRIGDPNTPGVDWRIGTWLIGLLGVMSNGCGKMTKAGLQTWCGILQFITSIGNYVTLFTKSVQVDIYFMIQDFISVLGDIAASLAAAANGGEPNTAVAGLVLKNAGFIMRLLKTQGKGAYTGLDLKV